MGKSGRKWKENVPYPVVENAINTLPIKELMPVAKIVCGADYAVCNYNRKGPFYKNDAEFRKALRRCITIGAFNHREIIIRMLHLEVNDEEQ